MGVNSATRPAAAASGSLEKTPLIHLVLYAFDKGLTGTMEFAATESWVASLRFIDGRPAKVNTSDPVVGLGEMLVKLGHITSDTLTRSLANLAQAKTYGKALLGQQLIRSGAIDHANLEAGLRAQILEKLKHVASYPGETTYAYYDQFDGLSEWGADVSQGFDPMPMAWEILLANPPHAHVDMALESVGGSLFRLGAGANLPRLSLSEQGRAAAETLRERSIRAAEVGPDSGLGELERRLLVYLLLITKQVELLRPADAPPRPGPGALASPAPSSTPSLRSRVSSMAAAPGPPTRGSVAPSQGGPIGAPAPPAPPGAIVPSPAPGGRVRPGLPAPPDGMARELAERWREIVVRSGNIDRADYFSMLDLARDSGPDEVQSAYFALAKQWHPDRLPAELSPVREACSRVFSRMSEAHATLSDPEKRVHYMRLLADGSGSPETQEAVAKVVEAAGLFQKAEVCLRRNDLVQAETLCRKAHEDDPTQPDYLAMLAWLLSMKPEYDAPEKLRECLQMLDRALAISGRCEKAHFWRGMIHKRLGKGDTAFRDFKRAAALNARNIDAAREVRLHRMRRGGGQSSAPPNTGRSTAPPAHSSPAPGGRAPPGGSEEKPVGLLGRLFKKK